MTEMSDLCYLRKPRTSHKLPVSYIKIHQWLQVIVYIFDIMYLFLYFKIHFWLQEAFQNKKLLKQLSLSFQMESNFLSWLFFGLLILLQQGKYIYLNRQRIVKKKLLLLKTYNLF